MYKNYIKYLRQYFNVPRITNKTTTFDPIIFHPLCIRGIDIFAQGKQINARAYKNEENLKKQTNKQASFITQSLYMKFRKVEPFIGSFLF